ncbi:MAG TPA: polysaccharide deacetylase family protein [Candidatus Tyrphobacter sp.]
MGILRFSALFTMAVAMLGALGFGAYEYGESPASQLFGATFVRGPASQHVVALTFDDGPNPPYTDGILDVLEREGVPATFFVVGRAVAAYPQVVRREVRDGDAIGNHTWDHAHLIVLDAGQIRRSLALTDAAIAKAAGTRTTLMRPPFGARDWFVLAQARRLGYTPVMWSVPLARDWENAPPRVIAERILRYVRNGSVIVLHDGNRGIICGRQGAQRQLCDRARSVAATRMIVDALKKRGYRFVTVPELIRLSGL